MTIQPWQPTNPLPTAVQTQGDMQNAAVARLGAWAESAKAAHEIAEILVGTAFVPSQFRNEPGNATAAILAGAEVGLSPMNALKSFDIIQGVAAPRAMTLRAIVQSQGHEIVLVESTATRCRMKGKRRGDSEWQPVTWTIDRARDLGLANKDQWKKQPTAMLIARATSELCRLIASDAILGIGLSYEEVADGAELAPTVDVPAVEAEPTQPRTMSRKTARARKTPSVQDGPVTVVSTDEADAEPRMITDDQLTKLHTCFTELGYSKDDRDKKLTYARHVTGREDLESSKALTLDEARAVIDALEADIAEKRQAEGGDSGG